MNQDKKQDKIRYPFLFSPFNVGMFELKNRLVALPVHTGFAHPDGSVSSWMIDYYARLAGSGAAMVVVANAAVSRDGVVSRFNLRTDKDEYIPGLAGLAAAIKQNGAISCLQLNHAGRFAKTERPLLPSPMNGANLAFNVESLKGFMEFFPFENRFNLTRNFLRQVKSWTRPMTNQERDRVIDDFANAAVRACRAGFDMVELHGANGYLLCQYLSPFTNKTASGFGGDFSGRTAFPLAVIQAMQERVSRNFPIGFRLLLRELVPGGIDLPEALAFAKRLEHQGIAYLSASIGTFNSIFFKATAKQMAKNAYLRQDIKLLTGSVNIPTIISGRILTPSIADNLIRDGATDLAGLGRPLRCDPEWVKKAQNADRKISVCINCNWCLKRVILDKGFACSRWPGQLRERTDLAHKLLTRTEKTLWILSDIKDMHIFKQSLPLLVRNTKPLSVPALVFPANESGDRLFESAKTDFIQWASHAFQSYALGDTPPCEVVIISKTGWEDAVHRLIIKGNYGRVFLCFDKSQAWRKKMLYKQRSKMVALLGSNVYRHRVIAPVDLSDTSLLAMVFLKNNFMEKEGFSVSFVHVPTTGPGPVKQQWERLKSIAGLSQSVHLQLIRPKTDVVAALAETICSGKYGTLVMGKRGFSGLKRWLLGSVSSGLLSSLTDQSLFLVD
ncbi:MAG: hypothetical protein GY874_18335 [Desulfobacteraceae bacterium]|nr:hypothetical protein [Desulfobacteraceae bacterium]